MSLKYYCTEHELLLSDEFCPECDNCDFVCIAKGAATVAVSAVIDPLGTVGWLIDSWLGQED